MSLAWMEIADKMSNGDTEAWLTGVLECLPGHKINRIGKLVPWCFHGR